MGSGTAVSTLDANSVAEKDSWALIPKRFTLILFVPGGTSVVSERNGGHMTDY